METEAPPKPRESELSLFEGVPQGEVNGGQLASESSSKLLESSNLEGTILGRGNKVRCEKVKITFAVMHKTFGLFFS